MVLKLAGGIFVGVASLMSGWMARQGLSRQLRLLRELAAREQAAGEAYANGRRPRSALLRDTDVGLAAPRLFTWRAWRKKLNAPAFDGVRAAGDFKALAAFLGRRPAHE